MAVAWYVSRALDLVLPLYQEEGKGYNFPSTILNIEDWIGNWDIYIYIYMRVYRFGLFW